MNAIQLYLWSEVHVFLGQLIIINISLMVYVTTIFSTCGTITLLEFVSCFCFYFFAPDQLATFDGNLENIDGLAVGLCNWS